MAWSLEVIGDGQARPEVENALAPLDGRVIWAGSLKSQAIADRLGGADLCVWPALNEAFGMSLLEAQASGLPVVAGRTGGVAEIVISGVTGLLVPAGDAPAFAAGVRSLMVNPRKRAAFAAAAQGRIRAEHDLSTAAARLGAVIDRVRWEHLR
jgi:glycosyltransferase involved in cell wall biosynthesis